MGSLDDYLEAEAHRTRDLSLNVLMDDGKWMFPIKILHAIKETENTRVDKKNEQVGKYRCLNEGVF